MGRVYGRRDRTARLLKIQILLWQNKHGLEVAEIARKCSISKRTAYRDINSLESELGIPIWEERSKRGIVDGYFLPPITLSPLEAMNIFLAARLMQHSSQLYDPNIMSTFMKLNTIVPLPLRNQIQNTMDYLEGLPRDERKLSNFNKITQAWLLRHKVKFQYQGITQEKPQERTIETYMIEPYTPGHSSYIIAYCNLMKSICTFKLDHIIGDVQLETETYEIPSSFNAVNYLSSMWDVYTGMETETVKLHFNRRIGKGVIRTTWHASQLVEIQNDGSVIMTLNIPNTNYFRNWVLLWGNDVEVLEPEAVRDQIINDIHSILNIYVPQNRT